MEYFLFIILAAAVIFLSIKLAKYVDLLDKTTKISGAFVGAVLLAAVTSLPELFTSISATLLIHENELVLGNILGSNLFNFTVLGLSIIIFVKSVHTANLSKSHILSCAAMALMYAFIALDMFLDIPKIGWFSMLTPFIVITYGVFLFLTPKTKPEETSSDFVSPLSLKQIVLRFTLAAIFLIGASVAITYVADAVAEKLSLGKTFAGALLLGITTSLPETVSTLSLCHKRNYNAAFGNIIGSNVFNCFIFVISDLLSFSENATDVYVANTSSTLMLIFGLILAALFAVFVGLSRTKKEHKTLKRTGACMIGSISIAAYIIFTALSMAM